MKKREQRGEGMRRGMKEKGEMRRERRMYEAIKSQADQLSSVFISLI